MGFDCSLKEVFTVKYNFKFDNGLSEHELNHVLIGEYSGEVVPNSEEVGDYNWLTMEEIKKDNQEKYAPWFKLILEKLD